MAKWLTSAVLVLSALAAYAQAPALYRLGPGDTISIQVMNHPEYSLALTIRPDGRVSYPTTGDLELTGLTPEQLRDLLRKSLSDRLRNPEVTVNVTGFRAMRLVVLGSVLTPGPVDVPQEGMVIRDALTRVGGVALDADPLKATLYPSGGEAKTVNLTEEMAAKPGAGTVMRAGDLLYVPKRVVNTAVIVGQVRTPGQVLIELDRTTLDYIIRVGGIADRADAKHSRLIRSDGTVTEVDLSQVYSGKKSEITLQPNDTLIVGTTEAQPPILVLGQVSGAGRYPYDPTVTLADLLSGVGAPTRDADAKHSRLLHQDGTMTQVDVQSVLEGQADDNLRGIHLQPGDILMIPKQMDRVALLGQVSGPGFYGLEEDMRLSELLTQAGGVQVQEGKGKLGYLVRRKPAPEGAPAGEKVEVRRLDLAGVLFRGNTKDDVLLQPDDVIYVPSEREPKFWEEYMRNPIAALGLISLLYSVFE